MASPAALETSAHAPRREAVGSSFAELDDVVQQVEARGLVRVTLQPSNHGPLARHVVRRAEQIGRECLVVADAEVTEPWRELAQRLGVSPSEPLDTAAAIAAAADGALLVVARTTSSRWGQLVQDEVARLAADQARLMLVVLETPSLQPRPQLRPTRRPAAPSPLVGSAIEDDALDLEIDLRSLSEADGQRWWAAVIARDELVRQDRFRDLAALDGWWEATRRLPMVEPSALPPLDDAARQLLGQIVDARQSLSGHQVAALDSSGAGAALAAAGLVRVDDRGSVTARDGLALEPLASEPRRELADALEKTSPKDGWALMRAAELLAEVGEAQQAEEVAFAALQATTDSTARDDLWGRWDALFTAGRSPQRLERLVRAADRALVIGDCDRASRMAAEAMTLDGDRFDVLLLHGRASLARGDTTTAALSLGRAMTAAGDAGARATAGALMAQVRLACGDPEQARRHALESVNDATDVATRLEARNVLGKLLFAVEEWDEAEAHFAADAYEAARAGLPEADLRARLNRAIAVLYTGSRERAREMLEEVMREGERLGIDRAVAYTLANLATLAILQHEYEHALALSERAIEVCRRVEPRASMVQPITNLAELRLRLGLLDEAEHGLRFGLHACGPNLPLSRYAYFAKVAACIHLERGDTALAAKELANAVSGATCANDLPVLAQCHRIAARIAIEDGDLTRARVALTQAAELKHTAFGQAELSVLEAQVARMAGEPFEEGAREALAVAQRADDPESLREAHLLLHHSRQNAGDHEAARSHLRAAVAERNRVADYLRASLRQRYLARPLLDGLRELEQKDLELDTFGSGDSLQRIAPQVGGRARVAPARPLRTEPVKERLLIGDSAPMRALRGTIKRVAATDATVLISGQTGTGKELVAEAIHRDSARRNGPLVKVNCAALVETLLLSELFGHEKGAFTGASSRRRGRFEVADGGTLFLDEIGDISPRTQVALLRVLQDGTFERVGGCSQLKTDVRIVCATHRDLKAMVERGEFREDLYYRLCGVVLEVPALRDRLSDLPVLAEALLKRAETHGSVVFKPLSAESVTGLSRHGWPGNVRELENALRVAALFARGAEIELSDFVDNVEGLRHLHEPTASSSDRGSVPPAADSGARSVESLPPPSSSTELVYAEIRGGTNLSEMKRRLEQECIARALVESGGNITQAAKLLGMKRPRLSQLVKQYKLASVLEDIKS